MQTVFWLSKLFTKLCMDLGMDPKQFAGPPLIALNDDSLKKALVGIMTLGVSELVSQQLNKSLNNQITSLKAELQTRDEKIAVMQKRIDELSSEADCLEQLYTSTRSYLARLRGIAENDSEDVTAKILDVLNNDLELDPPFFLSEVDRMKPKPKPTSQSPCAMPTPPPALRQVLINFATYPSQKRVMDLRAKLKNADYGLYMSEDLTKKRSELWYRARVLKGAKESTAHGLQTSKSLPGPQQQGRGHHMLSPSKGLYN
jgi:hypothetical protein